MKVLTTLLCLFLCVAAVAQTNNAPAKVYPHPYVEGALGLNGGGYSTVSFAPSTGIDFESKHFIAEGRFSYDLARKVNDGTNNNDKGHSIGYGGMGFFRLSDGWFFGGGYSYGKTITTNYDKEASEPAFGGGKDVLRSDWSGRFQLRYFWQRDFLVTYPTPVAFTPGPGQTSPSRYCAKCDNGLQGVGFDMWMPSPATAHHWFFHVSETPYWFHTTVTDPYNLPLTADQKSHHSYSSNASFGVMYRF